MRTRASAWIRAADAVIADRQAQRPVQLLDRDQHDGGTGVF
jgi:hypothetical protein